MTKDIVKVNITAGGAQCFLRMVEEMGSQLLAAAHEIAIDNHLGEIDAGVFQAASAKLLYGGGAHQEKRIKKAVDELFRLRDVCTRLTGELHIDDVYSWLLMNGVATQIGSVADELNFKGATGGEKDNSRV